MSKESDEEYFNSILSNIDKHGWYGIHVFDPDGELPSFTYSVGFSRTLNAPEFIIFGLSNELMHNMLWSVYKQIKEGKSVENNGVWSGLLSGFDCVSKHVTHSDTFSEYMVSSKWLWRQDGHEGIPEAYQIVWPGAVDGLFPWDEGCDQGVIDVQPRLW